MRAKSARPIGAIEKTSRKMENMMALMIWSTEACKNDRQPALIGLPGV
jgi:hypothetical protein